MAEAARALDVAGRSSDLVRNKQQVRVQRARDRGERKRGQVLRYPFSPDEGPMEHDAVSQVKPPGETIEFPRGRKVDEPLLYESGYRHDPVLLRQLENQNKARLQRERQRIEAQKQRFRLPELDNLPATDQQELQPDIEQAQTKMRELAARDRQLGATDLRRRAYAQAKEQVKQQLQNQIKEFAKDKILKKMIRKNATRVIGRGGDIEAEGAGAWVVFGLAETVTGIELAKGLIKPDGGDFLGEPIAFLEPANPDFKESLKMGNPLESVLLSVDMLDYSVLLFLITIIGVIVNFFLLIIGVMILGWLVSQDLIGGVFAFGSEFFSIFTGFIY